MTSPPAAPLLPRTAFGRGALVIAVAALALSAPLAAQQQPGTFSLPPATPSPTPAPAGPADERAGVAIPPRQISAPTEAESSQPAPTPLASPTASSPLRESAPAARASAPSPTPASTPQSQSAPAPAATVAAGPEAKAPAEPAEPATSADTRPVLPEVGGLADPAQSPDAPSEALGASILPDWWPLAAGGAGGLAVLGGAGLIWRRRRKRQPLRLAAPVIKPAAETISPAESDLPRLDLTLDITAATRSMMMFTLEYRLTIANRTERAVNDLNVALQLACARASAGAGVGGAQALGDVARIGPHQAQSVTGTLQLPLSAITPLRQGTTPLFVPLVHVTLEGEGQRALARSFVIGPPSASGRVHPIPLDQPPGGIVGLKAQAIAIPAVSAAA